MSDNLLTLLNWQCVWGRCNEQQRHSQLAFLGAALQSQLDFLGASLHSRCWVCCTSDAHCKPQMQSCCSVSSTSAGGTQN
jgi:hypothetical protein